MSGKYDDIINLPHPTSRKHPRMSAINRAAQFAPFAALTGYDAAVQEKGRLTDSRIELGETELAELDDRFQLIQEQIKEQPEIKITYFKPDEKKAGGAYVSQTGIVKRIDEYERIFHFMDGSKIPMDDVYQIEGEIFAILNRYE